MLDFRVYTFLAVCEYMNYTRAAEALHITQPAVSQHIRYLENMYQVKLFLAEGKTVSYTHLDVYKRQAIPKSAASLQNCLPMVPLMWPPW